ncbi:MAG TPA: Pycsar system effector family protein [Chitinophagaceae bacterium]|nr:Pycsar system effector family protein [Chitinophagaceae bacterium]
MDYHKLYKKIEEYVTGLFEKMHSPALVFHSLEHTQNVVKRTQEIAGHYKVTEDEMLILFTASWFHDTGHLFTEPSKHEQMSCEIMRKFMKDHIEDEKIIEQVEECIMSTRLPRNPKNLLQQIICDADTYHLGTKDFKNTNKRAFEERSLRSGDSNVVKFNQETIDMLQTHQFYTNYAKELLNERKDKNMKKLQNKIVKNEEENQNEVGTLAGLKKDKSEVGTLSGLEKDKSGLMSKGIQTMLRLTSENHLKLSDMADHKANILISVNAIIISVILGVLLRKLQEEPYLTIPTVIFLISAVTTIIISILATRPKISEGTFTAEDIAQKKTNLLFFGNFHKATYEQYNAAMRQLMLDTDYLYGSLIKDIYFLGVVLGRKYRLIRIAYNIFMIGIIVSVFAFAIAAYVNHGESVGTVINGTGSPL